MGFYNLRNQTIIYSFFIILLIFVIASFINNRNRVKPSSEEIIVLKDFYKSSLTINSLNDIIAIQNFTIDNIVHIENGVGEIEINKILKDKKGFCYHRSMVLQKVMLYNGISVRPVFLYSNPFDISTSIFDFFSNKVSTHNIFEFYWQEEWYVMETNQKINHVTTLNDFLKNQKLFENQPRYIRYLNNRNGRFIWPAYVPDVYGFF
jgi:hypothetical protein